MTEIILSRLLITGPINFNTPKSVLIEIADAHGIIIDNNYIDNDNYRKELINTINKTKLVVIKKPYNLKDYSSIARFINNRCDWILNKLMNAFNFLLSFFIFDKSFNIPVLTYDEIIYGIQTPDNPFTFNSCVLFGLCQYYRIDTNYNTSIENMLLSIKLTTLSSSSLYNILINKLSLIKNNPLYINITYNEYLNNLIENENKENVKKIPEYNYDILIQILNKYKGYIKNKQLPSPKTNEEAVVFAILKYQIDITKVYHPLKEYDELQKIKYKPYDKELERRLLSKYPEIDSPYLTECFNPYLPIDFYNPNILNNLAIREGITNEQIRNNQLYELLQIITLSNTFYHGKHINILNNKTDIEMEPIDNLDFNDIVCYGIKHNNMYAYTYRELKYTFQMMKRFHIPNSKTNEVFSEISINKLLYLSSHNKYNMESDDNYRIRLELSDIIKNIRLLLNEKSYECRQLLKIYHDSSDSIKSQINDAILSLHNLSMYMRGWNNTSFLPISSAPFDNQSIVDLNVTNGIVDFEKKCSDLHNIGTIILSLPLFKYRNNDFIISSNSDDGYTIRDRLNIVKSGDTTDNLSSCIRISSNWLAASSYYYMDLLGMKKLYDIKDLNTSIS